MKIRAGVRCGSTFLSKPPASTSVGTSSGIGVAKG